MAQQIKHAFIVTSAINSKFGVFDPGQRLQQTLDTIASIKNKISDAKIYIMECSSNNLTKDQEDILKSHCDVLIDYGNDLEVSKLYSSTCENDVKNDVEIFCFSKVLKTLNDNKEFDNIDRIHKISGRYFLDEGFDLKLYEIYKNRIIINCKSSSSYDPEVPGVEEFEYMARLYSWPKELTKVIQDVYNNCNTYLNTKRKVGIEYLLYKFLPKELVTEVGRIGVEGLAAVHGKTIRN